MSDRATWKMLHLLYTLPPGMAGLSAQSLSEAGVDCGSDTIAPLVQSGAVTTAQGLFALSPAMSTVMRACVIANKRWTSDDMWVDDPSAFVIMPFSEPWSDVVYRQMIEPGVVGAGMQCIRGDTLVRVGDLTQNIWGELLHAGVAIAEVSALNANVFYELGLAHALGKDVIIVKQKGAKVPADFGGAHYYEYDPVALDAGRQWLTAELSQWAAKVHSAKVKSLRLPSGP